MRWLEAFSLDQRLSSATMRTPFAFRLRVAISPWKSLPTFLNEPMVAMSLLLLWFEPATTAASMAIYRPKTIDDAPASGPEDTGVETFLPREEWASAQGKKVAATVLRLRRSRRSRS